MLDLGASLQNVDLRDTPIDPEAHWVGEPEKIEQAAEAAAS